MNRMALSRTQLQRLPLSLLRFSKFDQCHPSLSSRLLSFSAKQVHVRNGRSLVPCNNRFSRVATTRAFSTRVHVDSTQPGGDRVNLLLNGRSVQMPLMWLRDHCRCEECYNAATAQKNVDNYTLNHKLQAVEVHVADDSLTVEWQDGHYSEYSLKWIQKNFHCPGAQVERFLWDGPRMTAEPLPAVAFEQHMNSEEGLKQTLMNILQYGFCVVQGAPVTPKGTETVANRICFLAETVYKRLSIMTSGVLAHSDTAYTNLPLGAHTDTTYYSLPAGIQVFHCLHHDGEGGETLLVDGFNAAEKLRKSNPSYFDTLVRTEVPHECIEKSNYHLYCLGTVLSIDRLSGELTHIRYNPYDRAPLRTVAADDIPQFYASFDALTQIIRSKDSEFWMKLVPGNVLLVDNWRVMHGRSGFMGQRVICGCYLPRDDWLSKARVLGLL